MCGVDMALLANDVCGQPIPWEHCCPWMYYDGKLLQSKLIGATREKVSLLDLCDGQVIIVTYLLLLKAMAGLLKGLKREKNQIPQ